jgi:hypothetical protein
LAAKGVQCLRLLKLTYEKTLLLVSRLATAFSNGPVSLVDSSAHTTAAEEYAYVREALVIQSLAVSVVARHDSWAQCTKRLGSWHSPERAATSSVPEDG